MNRIARTLGLCLALLASGPALVHAQDFDPRGRKKPGGAKPGGVKKPGGAKKPGAGKPGAIAPVGPQTPPASLKPGGSSEGNDTELIERYTKIVLAQPGAPFPLQRLAGLYRHRDGGIDKALTDFESRARAAGSEQYAATVGLAGLLKAEGRSDDAAKSYEAAIALKPTDAAAYLALAALHQDRADLAKARQRYEEGLARQSGAGDKQQTLRTLLAVALDQKDFAAAKAFHEKLVTAEKGNLFVKGELGRELYARGEFSRAADEFKGLVAAAQGDNRVLAPALKDYGRALAKAGRGKEALEVLRQALRASGSQAGVRTELYEVIAEVYRKEQRVPELLAELEKEGGSDSARLLLLGSLYEESGDTEKALATYKRALGQNPRNLDVRLKVVRLYQARGELDKAITEYEALVRAAPNNPTFVFELTEALLQRGERARALTILSQVEARARGDEDILGRIADYYGRLGESARAVRLLERLATSTSADPGHIVDLGDRHYQSGNVPLAVQTWKRLLTTVTPRAKALSALADVYLEHDMVQEALGLVQEAVSLDKTNVVYKKQLATALERAQRPAESEAVWNELLAKAAATQDVQLAREARSRVVSSWSLRRTLAAHVVPLRKRLEGKPPDLEAGRMLAEVEVRLRNPADAERTLRQVLLSAPGDVDSYLALERALVSQNKIAEAISVLEKLVVVDPKRSRELYTRMAQYALSVYKDADAVRYATKAVELNPDDAEGYRKLGELHAKRQQNDKAIAAYRQAIAKNERLYPVYFLLAELLAAKGEDAEADRLLRKVIRSAPDDELVVRATRQAMQLAERSGTLQSLEEDLLPMALASPGRPVFRKLLVTIYGTLTAKWQRESREGTPAERAAATAQLDKTGKRAVKVLLDALADKDPSGQRIAIELLAHEGNRAAALPLLAFATSDASAPLRVRAMLACAASGETSLAPKLIAILDRRSQDPNLSGRVASAAVWTLAELGGAKAYPALRKILAGSSPELRAIAAYTLRADRDPKTTHELARLASTRGEAPQLRAFAILSATAQTTAERTAILALASDPEPWVAHAALVRMARAPLSAAEARELAERAASRLYARRSVRPDVAVAAAYALSANGPTTPHEVDPLSLPEFDAESLYTAVVRLQPDAPVDLGVLEKNAAAIARGLSAALASADEKVRREAEQALAADPGTLAPFATSKSPGSEPNVADRIAASVEPAVTERLAASSGEERQRLLAALGRTPSDSALRTLATEISSPRSDDSGSRRAALEAIGRAPVKTTPAEAIAAVLGASKDSDFRIRSAAVRALARLAARGQNERASAALADLTRTDAYALVRDQALRELFAADRTKGIAAARSALSTERDPQVRALASRLAEGKAP